MSGEIREVGNHPLTLEIVLEKINSLLTDEKVSARGTSLGSGKFHIDLLTNNVVRARCVFDFSQSGSLEKRPVMSFQRCNNDKDKDKDKFVTISTQENNWESFVLRSVELVNKKLQRLKSSEVNLGIKLQSSTKADTIPFYLSQFLNYLPPLLRRDFSVLWYYGTGEIFRFCLESKEAIGENPEIFEYNTTYERFKKGLQPYLQKTLRKLQEQETSVLDKKLKSNFIKLLLEDWDDPEFAPKGSRPDTPEKPGDEIERLYKKLSKDSTHELKLLLSVLWYKVYGYERKRIEGSKKAIQAYADLSQEALIEIIRGELKPREKEPFENFLQALLKEKPR